MVAVLLCGLCMLEWSCCCYLFEECGCDGEYPCQEMRVSTSEKRFRSNQTISAKGEHGMRRVNKEQRVKCISAYVTCSIMSRTMTQYMFIILHRISALCACQYYAISHSLLVECEVSAAEAESGSAISSSRAFILSLSKKTCNVDGVMNAKCLGNNFNEILDAVSIVAPTMRWAEFTANEVNADERAL